MTQKSSLLFLLSDACAELSMATWQRDMPSEASLIEPVKLIRTGSKIGVSA